MPKKKVSSPIKGIGRAPESQLTVLKSRPLEALSQSELSLPEFKLLDLYLARINSHDPEKNTITLEKGEIEDALGVTKINAEDLTERLLHLGQGIKIPDKTKSRGFRIMWLFDEALCETDENGLWKVTLSASPKAMRYFFNIEELGYFRYKLRSIKNMTSRYTYVLFLYLEKQRNMGLEWKINLDDLRKMLNSTASRYEQFKFFNSEILKRCQQEIHEKTECRFTYEPIRKGRKVCAVKFVLAPLSREYEIPEQLEMPGFTESEPVFDISQSEAERRDLYRDALAPYALTDDQIDELVQLARKHIDARGHFTGSDLDQQIYNYLLSAKRHATTNSRSEIKNIYRYLLPIIKSNDIGW